MNQPLKTFCASLDALPEVLACVDDCIGDCIGDSDSDTIMRARIAVEELFVNVVRHGSPQSKSVQVWLEVSCAAGQVSVRFEDSAAAFDPFAGQGLALASEQLVQPLELRCVGGVGRLLVRQLADSVRYSHSAGHNRTELLFSPRSR